MSMTASKFGTLIAILKVEVFTEDNISPAILEV